MEISSQIMAMKQSATQQTATLKIIKKQHEMQMSMIDLIAQTAKTAPPAGQGLVIDKTA